MTTVEILSCISCTGFHLKIWFEEFVVEKPSPQKTKQLPVFLVFSVVFPRNLSENDANAENYNKDPIFINFHFSVL